MFKLCSELFPAVSIAQPSSTFKIFYLYYITSVYKMDNTILYKMHLCLWNHRINCTLGLSLGDTPRLCWSKREV